MRPPIAPQFALSIVLASGLWGGCSAPGGGSTPERSNGGGVAVAEGGGGASGVASPGGAPGAGTSSGLSGAVGVALGGGAALGGAMATGGADPGAGAGAGAGGSNAQGGVAGASAAGAAGQSAGGAAGSGAAGAAGAVNCNLPATVSFQKDVQGFLTTSCGKGVSSGCHVTDTSKTSLGFDHAYDWITAIAHPSSCGGPPYPERFQVVMAVLQGANPPSCSNSRIMPPPGMGTPLTACQMAALQAWLDEPQVSQMHVPETDETKNLYPAGPYLMPPFN